MIHRSYGWLAARKGKRMDNSLLTVREINHKYFITGRRERMSMKELRRRYMAMGLSLALMCLLLTR